MAACPRRSDLTAKNSGDVVKPVRRRKRGDKRRRAGKSHLRDDLKKHDVEAARSLLRCLCLSQYHWIRGGSFVWQERAVRGQGPPALSAAY